MPLLLADRGTKACPQIIDEPLVLPGAGGLGDHDEARATPDPPELVLEGLKARAVTRQELAQIGVRRDQHLEREVPGDEEHGEGEPEYDPGPAAAFVDDGPDQPPHHASAPKAGAGRDRPLAKMISC